MQVGSDDILHNEISSFTQWNLEYIRQYSPSQISCTFLLLAAKLMQKEMSSRSTRSSGHSSSIFISWQHMNFNPLNFQAIYL